MRLGRAAAFGVAWSLVALRAGSAQLTVTVDVGASHVEYDGFLPSGAASVSPALRFSSPSVSFAARGTWLGFESGNASVQGLLAGSVFTPPAGRWRGELGATAGVSTYESYADFAHALARARVITWDDRAGLGSAQRWGARPTTAARAPSSPPPQACGAASDPRMSHSQSPPPA